MTDVTDTAANLIQKLSASERRELARAIEGEAPAPVTPAAVTPEMIPTATPPPAVAALAAEQPPPTGQPALTRAQLKGMTASQIATADPEAVNAALQEPA